MWRVLGSYLRCTSPAVRFGFSTAYKYSSLQDIQTELINIQSPDKISDIMLEFITNSQAIAQNTDKHQIIKFLDFLDKRNADPRLYSIIPELLDHKKLTKLTHNEIVYITWKLSLKASALRNTNIFYKLETTLEDTIQNFPADSYKNIVSNFLNVYKNHWKLTNPKFANALLEGMHKNARYMLKEPKIMLFIGKLAKDFYDLGINLESHIYNLFKSNISSRDLQRLNNKTLSFLGNGISQVFCVNSSKPNIQLSDGKEFFDVWADILLEKSQLNLLSIEEAASSLRPFVVLDRGNEELLNKLEAVVFSDLKHLSFQTFNSLFYVYHKRIKFDHSYMINYIWGNLTKEVVRRNYSIPVEYFSGILVRLLAGSKDYGIYCDKETSKFLVDKIYDPWIQNASPKLKCKYYTTLLAYLTHAAYDLELTYFKDIDNYYTQYMRSDDSEGITNYALHAIRRQLLDSSFWDLFVERWGEIRKDETEILKFYILLTSLKLTSPEVYGRLEEEYNVEEDRIRYAEEYKKNHTQSNFKSAYFQNKVEEILKQNNIEFETEYFDEFYIDIALPQQKLAFELNGPLHYVLPSSNLNGKSEFRCILLRKLGWRVVNISFRTVKHERFDNSLFSILKSYMVNSS